MRKFWNLEWKDVEDFWYMFVSTEYWRWCGLCEKCRVVHYSVKSSKLKKTICHNIELVLWSQLNGAVNKKMSFDHFPPSLAMEVYLQCVLYDGGIGLTPMNFKKKIRMDFSKYDWILIWSN